jgi:hypothetical protein
MLYIDADKPLLCKRVVQRDALCTMHARYLIGVVREVTRIAAERRQNIIRQFMIILGNITCLFYGPTGS